MRIENSKYEPPIKLLTCSICKQVFFKPITLFCGHTFCRNCLSSRPQSNMKSEGLQQKKNQTAKLNVCIECQSIIWKHPSQMKENVTLQSVVSKFYNDQLQKRVKQISHTKVIQESEIIQTGDNQECLYNKILIKIKEPAITPMPYCYSQLEFQTAFIDDVVGQSQSIILTWNSIEKQGLGLCCRLIKVEHLNKQSIVSRIVFQSNQSYRALNLRYRGLFLGKAFVKIHQVETIQINLRNKIIILGEEGVDKIVKNLQVCKCSIFHSANRQAVNFAQFQIFFRFYDSMNNPHYLKQIRKVISDEPFQTRNNSQAMIYCILRLLKISNQMRKDLVLKFDDKHRMEQINHWLLNQRAKMIDDIINVQVPGNYNSGFVFFIIFLLLAFNLFQDYGNKQNKARM